MERILDDFLEVIGVSGENHPFFLKPCPICGSEDGAPNYIKYRTLVGDRWRITCLNCMLTMDPGYAQDRATVQAMWNKRAKE